MKVRKMIQMPEKESGQLDVRKLLSSAARHWYLFIAGLMLCLGLAYFYLQYTTPVYNISSTLLIKEDIKGPGLNVNTGFNDSEIVPPTNKLDDEIEVLKSRGLMQRALMELSLQTGYFIKGQFKDQEIYGNDLPLKALVDKIDQTAYGKTISIKLMDNHHFLLEETDDNDSVQVEKYLYGQKIEKPYATFTIIKWDNFPAYTANTEERIFLKFHNIHRLTGSFTSVLSIVPASKNTNVLILSFTDPVPAKGQDIVNKLVEIYNRDRIEDKNLIASKTIDFLDERLHFISEELSKVEKDVEKYKRKNEVANVSLQAQSYVDNASDYKNQLSDLNIQIEVLESTEAYIQEQGENYELVPSTLSIKDAALLGLISKFNEIHLERERMLRTAQPENPLVQSLDAQLKSFRMNILENLRNIKNDLVITRSSLQASSGQYAAKIQKVPSIERDLLEINRRQGIKQGLYLYLLQKREESALALAASSSHIRIIDPAVAGMEPASPNEKVVLLLALLLGVFFPLGYLYIKEALNTKVQERKDIECLTRVPIIGEIAHSNTKSTIVVTELSRTPAAELFRHIRSNINFATAGKENKVIMVTSSMGGEGKTFFSINLAASLVLTGKKVVIIDLDLRKPKVLANLGFPNEIGVTDYIMSETMAIDEIIKPIPVEPPLLVISTGPIPPNPAEFSMNPKLPQMVEDLKKSFDYIIVDTAPIGQVVDALELAPFVDSTLYVVRYNYTFKEQIEIVEDLYEEKQLRNLMIVLNDAKKENSYRYGYGYGYETGKKRKQGAFKG